MFQKCGYFRESVDWASGSYIFFVWPTMTVCPLQVIINDKMSVEWEQL